MTTDLPQFSSRTPELGRTWQLLAEEGFAAGSTVIFIPPQGFNLLTDQVRGFFYAVDSGWQIGVFPIPAVIVDNVFVHIARRDREYARIKRTLRRIGIHVLNPRLPDKWGVWRALRQSSELRTHLPRTDLLESFLDVEKWLLRDNAIFLKPVRGSGGHGVIQVRSTEAGFFAVTETKGNRLLSQVELSILLDELLQKEKHLLQSGLSLIEINGSKVDFRVVLHRDGEGRWQPIATVPRLGASGQVITNLAQGGQVRSMEWLAEQAEKREFALPAQEVIEQVAVLAAGAVTRIRPTLAFLGIDIGLDVEGHLWVLDINPRPGRKVLTREDRRLAFSHLVAFARWLANRDADA